MFLAAALGVPMGSPAGTLGGSFVVVATNSIADLTAEGPLDWVHWGLNSEYGFDRKANASPQVGPLTTVVAGGGLGPYRYADNLSGFSWTDGAPDAWCTNTTTGVWAAGKGSGFQFTLPADTILRRLRVHVGAFEAQGQFDAWLSDTNVPAYSDSSVIVFTNAPGGIYTLDYAANSPGETLTVRYLVKQQYDNKVGNVTLQAAAVAYVSQNNPPSATLASPANNTVFAAGTSVLLSAIASDSDGGVTNVQFFQGESLLGETGGPDWTFLWTNADPGLYSLRCVATDNGGLSGTSAPVALFICGSGGLLSGSAAPLPAWVDLSGAGPRDWVLWGSNGVAPVERLAGGASLIPGFTQVGTNSLRQLADYPVVFSWTNGSPDLTGAGQTAAAVAGTGDGFLLRVPAETWPQTLSLWVGLYASQGNLQAWLSDFSAPAYTDASVLNIYNSSAAAYTLTFAAAEPGQALNVRYTSLAQYDMTYGGNVWLAAAALAGTPPPPPAALLAPSRCSAGFTFCLLTQPSRTYTVECSATLTPGSWQTLTNFAGDGTTVTVTDPNPDGQGRFYRVLTQ